MINWTKPDSEGRTYAHNIPGLVIQRIDNDKRWEYPHFRITLKGRWWVDAVTHSGAQAFVEGLAQMLANAEPVIVKVEPTASSFNQCAMCGGNDVLDVHWSDGKIGHVCGSNPRMRPKIGMTDSDVRDMVQESFPRS